MKKKVTRSLDALNQTYPIQKGYFHPRRKQRRKQGKMIWLFVHVERDLLPKGTTDYNTPLLGNVLAVEENRPIVVQGS